MKKRGIINGQLAGYIATLGHMDTFLIGDAGMPIPMGIPIVDLALCGGVPTFSQVLHSVIEETQVEYYYLAEEIVEKNKKLHQYICEELKSIPSEMMPHSEFKVLTKTAKFAIRTGEFSPYPNIILRSGVVF